ncbi:MULTISPECIES: hypothetical protein [unclassified Kitasatospora]|uniref:hypothetical protein n=1 Tax=unclassified Kitasatospora TaxID=2633591 RepID=UPI00070FE5D1|nr:MULTISPECIES: hypothetical protein [unclassified Kitasatospora]KQV14644.1 hypothetical protein ASC99_31375 [Kitasatospora sp. Root107]KRB72460.1 hypothetical protein ASE03_23405 [Kitasatospora sp. Root187]
MTSNPVLVRVADHSFGLLDAGMIPSGPEDFSTGLIVIMTAGTRIHTGIDSGPVAVAVTVRAARPPETQLPADDWTEIVEASIHAPNGSLRVDSLANGPTLELPLLTPEGAGWYRILVQARGRDNAFDAVVSQPVEDYQISIWPEPPSPPRIIQAQDHCGQGLRLSAAPRPAQQPLPPSDPYGSTAERERQVSNRAILRQISGQRREDPGEPPDQPWRPEPDKPAPRPRN